MKENENRKMPPKSTVPAPKLPPGLGKSTVKVPPMPKGEPKSK